MKLSYIGTRATKDSSDKKRYAEAKWKDGDMRAEDIGYIFRCLLNDTQYYPECCLIICLSFVDK